MYQSLMGLVSGDNFSKTDYKRAFEAFYDRMKLDQLNISQKDKRYLQCLFDRAKGLNGLGKTEECEQVTQTLMAFIEYKVAKYRCNHFIDSCYILGYQVKKELASHYMLIEEALVNKDLIKVSDSYFEMNRILLHVDQLKVNKFKFSLEGLPLSLCQCIDFESFKSSLNLDRIFQPKEIEFMERLFDEAVSYYDKGALSQGKEVWKDLNDLVFQHTFHTGLTQ